MLTSDEFSFLYQHLELSSKAQAVLEHIRSSPPTRRVGRGGKHVAVRYPRCEHGRNKKLEERRECRRFYFI